MKSFSVISLLFGCATLTLAQPSSGQDTLWVRFPDPRITVNGLPWFTNNSPELWRLPKSSKEIVPAGVWNRAVAPDGGRVRFVSSTSRLRLKVHLASKSGKPCFFDAYTNGVSAGSAKASGTNEIDMILFETDNRDSKDVTIYLPNNHEVRLLAIGIDPGATITNPRSFALKRPVVCYGSSVLQGTGATHPSKTYPAVLARHLNVDFVNLGFGGAGKAEREVVELVSQLEACCYIFDLGKSYGSQGNEPFVRMLETIRRVHQTVPIICVTPIYSLKEADEADYVEKSENLRALMRQAAIDRQKAGDKFIFVAEGPALFGKSDKNLFSDALHPNDNGNERLAERLAPLVSRAIFNNNK